MRCPHTVRLEPLGHLASHLAALLPHVDASSAAADGGLKVICIGSVWKSWNMFRDAFLDELNALGGAHAGLLRSMTLLRPRADASVGAALRVAASYGVRVQIDYAELTEVMHAMDSGTPRGQAAVGKGNFASSGSCFRIRSSGHGAESPATGTPGGTAGTIRVKAPRI